MRPPRRDRDPLDGREDSEGHPAEPRSEVDRRRVYFYVLLPNLMLSLHPDYVITHRLSPTACDRTEIVCDFHVHPSEIARPGFDLADVVEFWDLTNRQDWQVSELTQLGLKSRAYSPRSLLRPRGPALRARPAHRETRGVNAIGPGSVIMDRVNEVTQILGACARPISSRSPRPERHSLGHLGTIRRRTVRTPSGEAAHPGFLPGGVLHEGLHRDGRRRGPLAPTCHSRAGVLRPGSSGSHLSSGLGHRPGALAASHRFRR